MVTAIPQLPPSEYWRGITSQLALPSVEEPVSTAESERSEPVLGHNALFAVALSSQKKGEYQKAIACYSEIIEHHPQIAGAYINRGAAYESTGDLDLALQDLNTALALESNPITYNNRGIVYFKKGDYERAIHDYTAALEIDPGNFGAYIYRGHAFSNLAIYDLAIRDYGEALALNPSNAKAYTSIGIVHSLREDHDNAIENYNKALKLDSRDPFTYLNRGTSQLAKGDDDIAEKDFGKALELDPECLYAYGLRSLVFSKRGDIERAVRDLDRVLQLEPHNKHAQAVRGSLYLEKGDLDRAIRDLDKAVDLDPQNTNAYKDRGIAYERKGDLARALEDYDRSLRIRPNQAAYVNRGLALLRLSRWDEAKSDLLSARNMGMDLVSVFRADHGSVAAFEEKNNLKLPPDIADIVSLDEAPQPALTGGSILDMFERLRKSVPPDTWDELPTDLVKNKKHYLYGHPKET